MKIALIFAMRAEAQPLIDSYGLEEQEGFFSPLPTKAYPLPLPERRGEIYVILNGVDHDRDLIGCEAAAITTQVAIQRLQPDLVISCGTCGGWQRYGARVGQAYIADGVMFHDRRVSGDNEWDTQGLGNYPVWEGSWQLAEKLHLPMGKVTTGSSFDLTPEEDAFIDQNGGRLKEMEGAAVAFVCSMYHVPVMLIKAVTNLRDKEEGQIEEFQANMKKASDSLLEACKKVVNELGEK